MAIFLPVVYGLTTGLVGALAARSYYGDLANQFSDANQISDIPSSSSPNGFYHAERNAIAHAQTSALIMQQLGPYGAEFIGDANELLINGAGYAWDSFFEPDPVYPSEAEYVDQHNNSIGRQIVQWLEDNGLETSTENIQDLIKDAYDNGDLITNLGDPRIPDFSQTPDAEPNPTYTGPASADWQNAAQHSPAPFYEEWANDAEDELPVTVNPDIEAAQDLWESSQFVPQTRSGDPLVLDLDGDGIELTSLQDSSAFFDYNGDGISEATGWVAPDDGLLAVDKNGNGQIDGVQELFGTLSTTGFVELDAYDTNGDNAVTAADANFADLRIWQDLNGDGLTDAGEVQTLDDWGITSLSLSTTQVDYTLQGNWIPEISSFTMNGQERELFEVFFSIDFDDNGVFDPNGLLVGGDPALLNLPLSRGYDFLESLQQAMSDDAALRTLVEEFAGAEIRAGQPGAVSLGELKADAEAILMKWAGTENATGQRVPGFSESRLEFLETMYGDFTPDASGFRAGLVEQAWNVTFDLLFERLLVQGPLEDIFPNARYDFVTDSLTLGDDLSTIMVRVNAELDVSDLAMIFEVRDILVSYQEGLNATEAEINQTLVQLISDALGSDAAVSAILAAFDADGVVDTSSGYSFDYPNKELFEGGFRNDLVIAQAGEIDAQDPESGGALIVGGDGTDVLIGTYRNDVLVAGEYNPYSSSGESQADTLFGGDGNDTFILGNNVLTGGENTLAVGGNGDDWFSGRNIQNVSIDGGNGDDTFSSVSGSNLTITMGAGADTFQWNRFVGNIQNSVIDLGAGDDEFRGNVNNNNQIFGGAGNDMISGGSTNGAAELGDGVIDGGEGDDTISVGRPSNMIIHGGEGNDQITAGNASPFGNAPTFLYGDEGDDAIIINGNSGNYFITDGVGDDTITKTGYARTTITIAADAGSTDTIDNVEWFYDSQDWQTGETVRYTRYDTQISLENFPSITSFDDLVITAQGTDSVIALPNGQSLILKDIAPSEVQPTFFVGAAGSGSYAGTDGNDRIIGSSITDEGASGSDTIDGKAGNDWLDGAGGDDVILGGDGNDTLIGGIGADRLVGGKGDDLYLGGASGGTDRDGTPYNNASTDTDGDIFVITKDANSTDTISWFSDFHGDQIDLSGFTDITGFDDLNINFQQYGDTTINLPNGQTLIINTLRSGTLSATDFIFAIEVNGTSASDTLDGTEAGDVIFGLEGNDILSGLGGDDMLDGGAGEDRLTGGSGVDLFRFSDTEHSTKAHDDRITDFEDGVDMIDVSGLGFHSIVSGAGSTAGVGILRYVYSAGANRTYVINDQTDFQFFFDGDYRGLLTSDDFILDTPTGPVTIDGTSGNDILTGGATDDRITGGLGADTLTGGAGVDHFIYTDVNDSQKFGDKDRITDFEDGTDLIDLSALPFYSITNNAVTAADQINIVYNANIDRTYIENDPTEFQLILEGDYSGLTEADFIFATVPTNNPINGTSAAETLTGTGLNDTIRGEDGNDIMTGEAGDDILIGGAGADRLTGGAGADIFTFESLTESVATGGVRDRITDFEDGIDMLDVSGLGFTNITDAAGATTDTTTLRVLYSTAADRTYIMNDQTDFQFFLDGDFRGQLTAADFAF